MDYSQFVYAVQENNTEQLNSLVPIITSVLIKFLKVRYNASHHDAQDCAQSTLMLTTEKIKNDKIKNPDSIIYYLFTTARNEYVKLMKKDNLDLDQGIENSAIGGDQLANLLDEERQSILKLCIDSLKNDFKTFIEYWFKHPQDEAQAVADHFNISVNNAWTRKHRIIKLLKECCQKKLSL